MKRLILLVFLFNCFVPSGYAVSLDNGQTGTDQFSVDIDENAYSTIAIIQAPGEATDNLMYEYIPYLDFGTSASCLNGGSWTDSNASDGSVSSQGTTNGINWSVTNSLFAGDMIMSSVYTLSVDSGVLPSDLRFFQYLDEDVYSISNNILVVSGSIAGGNLDLLTVHPDIHAGVSQTADDQATGWIADEFSDLRTLLESGGVDAAATGTIDTSSLTPYNDSFYGPSYGPEDITTAIEWEIPQVACYSFTAYLGGLPDAPRPIPEPATMLLLGSGLIGLAGFRKKFRK